MENEENENNEFCYEKSNSSLPTTFTNKDWYIFCFSLRQQNKILRLIFLLQLFFLNLSVVFAQVEPDFTPFIRQITPNEIFPGMSISIEGEYLGSETNPIIIFKQGQHEYQGKFVGGISMPNDFGKSKQVLNIVVPDEIIPGICQIYALTKGKLGNVIEVDVLKKLPTPKIYSIKPKIAVKGDYIAIVGVGFIDSDLVEITGLDGVSHKIKPYTASSASWYSFELNEKIPEGTVKIDFVDKKGNKRNLVGPNSFRLVKDVAPLDYEQKDFEIVSPNQWMEIYYSVENLKKESSKIEFKLQQGSHTVFQTIKDLNNVGVTVPSEFLPGMAIIQNRVWKEGIASEWSAPIEIEIAPNPREIMVYSLNRIPEKAEARIVQNGNVIKKSKIDFRLHPSAKFPEKLGSGELEIQSRFKEDGKWTGWKKEFNIEKVVEQDFPKGIFNLNSYENSVSIKSLGSKPFKIKSRETLQINGQFFVNSKNDIRLTLKNGIDQYSIKPKKNLLLNVLSFKIPKRISKADWEISITNLVTQTSKILPTKLRIE